MSIENQIERINQNISNTYTELEALGADAPDNKNSDNLAATVQSVKAILYTNQDLTEDQKEQARKNIGLDSGQNVAKWEPAEGDIPCVYLYTGGVGMPFTKNEGERQVRMVYESRTKNAEYYLTAKVQGSSSAGNPGYKKRNWTFKFYTDSTYEKKLKISFRGWP